MDEMKRSSTPSEKEPVKRIFPRAFLLFLLSVLAVIVFNHESITGFANVAALDYVETFVAITVNEDALLPEHTKTPEAVKAVYMSSWVAGSPKYRDKLVNLIDTTELNAVVVDVKDSTGIISFEMNDPLVKSIGATSNRIPDVKALLKELHDKNIYVIARIAVFQDPYITK